MCVITGIAPNIQIQEKKKLASLFPNEKGQERDIASENSLCAPKNKPKSPFFKYFDSNSEVFTIARCKVISLNLLCLSFCTCTLLFFLITLFFALPGYNDKYVYVLQEQSKETRIL